MARYSWVRFNAITGVILERDLKVQSDSIKTDINGYDEINLTLPAYGLKTEDRLKWAEEVMKPWGVGVALVDTDNMTALTAGILVQTGFDGSEESIDLTAYNIMEYFKKLIVPAPYTPITSATATATWTGATWGEVYAEVIRSGTTMTGAPADVKYPQNLQLLPRTAGGKSYTVKLTELPTAFSVITDLRDSYTTSGEEVVFDAELQGSGELVGRKVVWVQKVGSATNPHINAGKNTPVTKISTVGDSGQWKAANFSFDSDATSVYNKLLIVGSTNSTAPKIGVGGKTPANTLTLTEVFDSGTDLNDPQMSTQMTARLTGSMATQKDITVDIVDDFNNWWLKNVGRMVSIFPGKKTMGSAVYGRVTEITYTSTKPGCFTLSVSPPASRYPKLPSQKKKEGAGLAPKTPSLDNWGGTEPVGPGGISPWDPSLDPGINPGGGGDIFPGDFTPGDPGIPDFGEGGFGPTVTLSGTVFDMYNARFEGVTVSAYSDAGLTTLVDSTTTDDEGNYSLNVPQEGKFWVVATYKSTSQTHINSPIETEDQEISEINFTLPTSNPLKLYRVYGKISNPPASRVVDITQAQTVSFFTSGTQATTYTSVPCDANGYFIAWLPSGAYNAGFRVSPNAYWGETFFITGKNIEIGEIYATRDASQYAQLRLSVGGISNIQGIRVDGYADEAMTELITSGVSNSAGQATLIFPEEWDNTKILYVKAIWGKYVGYSVYNAQSLTHDVIYLTDIPLFKVKGKMDAIQTSGQGAYRIRVVNSMNLNTYTSDFTGWETDSEGFFTVWLPKGSYAFGKYAGNSQGTPISTWGMNNKINGDTEVGIQYAKSINISSSPQGFYACNVWVYFSGATQYFSPSDAVKVEAFTDSAMTQSVGYGLAGAGVFTMVSLSTTLNVSSTTTTMLYYKATWRDQTATAQASAFISDLSITFNAPPLFTISGKVYTATGALQTSGTVRLLKTATVGSIGSVPTAVINSSGEYTFAVAPGDYTLQGQGPAPVPVKVTNGNVSIDLKNEAGATQNIGFNLLVGNSQGILGKIRLYSDESYSSLIGEYVLNTPGSSGGVNSPGNMQTAFQINIVKYPNVWVEAEAEGKIIRDAILNITATQSRAIVFNMLSMYTITGKVYTPTDELQRTGSVTLYNAANLQVISLTSPISTVTGGYSFSVPSGLYMLDGQGPLTAQVDVKDSHINLDFKNETGTNTQIFVSPSIGGVVVPSKITLYSDSDFTTKVAEYQPMLNTNGKAVLTAEAQVSNERPYAIIKANFTKYPKLWVEVERGGLTEKAQVPEPNIYGLRIVNATFAETYTVSGTVATSAGVPVANAVVNIAKTGYASANGTRYYFLKVQADADGKYSIRLPRGGYNLSKQIATARERMNTVFAQVVDQDLTVNLLADPPGNSRAISGYIRINASINPQNWEAQVQFSLQADFSEIYDTLQVQGQGYTTSIQYAWYNSPINTPVYVRVRYKGLNYPFATPVQGTATTVGTANFTIDRTGYEVKGKIKTTGGDPVAVGQRMNLWNTTLRSSVVDENGNFTFTNIPSGTYMITDQTNTYMSTKPVVVTAGDVTDVEIIVGELSTFRLNVQQGGVKIGNIKVTVEDADGTEIFETFTNDIVGSSSNYNAEIMAYKPKVVKIHMPKKVYDFLLPEATTGTTQTLTFELPM